jgi:hypothetical protein
MGNNTRPDIDLSALGRPFPPSAISWRLGATNHDKTKGIALAYIDARDVMDRLDEVCGQDRWQNIYTDSGNGKTCCQIGILCGEHWVWKANGAGDTDVEADKGAFSDGFKRAAVQWDIGRYLYNLDSPWVEIEPKGKSFAIKKSELPALKAIIAQTVKTYIPLSKKRAWAEQTRNALAAGDKDELRKLWDEWENEEKIILWNWLSPQETTTFKHLLGTTG